jgi:hypothetical protein
VKLLVTTSRMPFAVGLVRRLADAGHTVYASDAYEVAPGSHSRYVAEHFVTAAPGEDPPRFAAQVAELAAGREVDLVVPTWEDVFYLSVHRGDMPLYAAPFPTLARLHDKASFDRLCGELGVRAPATAVARSQDELLAAIERFPRYFGRAVYSRGGVSLLTNTGPLAGHVRVEDCDPTPRSPWLVQEFVDGPMVCTYSTLHDGRPTAHCTYRAPRQWEHSTGIQFESVDSDESLAIAERIGGALGYTGQISFDFVQTPDGLVIIECNPRTTDGVLLMSADQVGGGIAEPERELEVTPPGEITQIDFAVFAAMFADGLREAPSTIRDLWRVRGSDRGWHDQLPFLYSFLALAHHERLSLRERQQLFAAMSADVCWDGDPIPGMSDEDAAALRDVQAPS